MARKSKSSENKDKSASPEEHKTSDVDEIVQQAAAESSEDEPTILEEPEDEVSDEAMEASVSEADDAEQPVEPEVEEEILPEPEPEPEPEPVAASGGASWLALVFGGLIAGGLGYFAANFAPEPEIPEFDAAPLTASIEANAETISALSGEVDALKSATEGADLAPQVSELGETLSGLNDSIAALQESVSQTRTSLEQELLEIDTRILALETAVPTATDLASGDELAALRARISEMTSAAEEQLAAAQSEAATIARAAEEARLAAEAEAEEVRAAAAAREAEILATAQRQEALISLRTAVEAGAPFADILASLDAVPDVLVTSADAGVPSVQALQQSFPDAARAALAQSTVVTDDASAGERFSAFLQRRVNARSLTPQEGDSPDAILSRAEASVMSGDLVSAIDELSALPDGGKAALATWLEQANTRLSALEAVDQMSATN